MLGVLKLLIFLGILAIAVKMSVKISKSGRSKMEFEVTPALKAGVILVILSLFILPAIGAIPAGTRGVVLRLGAVTGRVLPEGIYVLIPAIERAELMSVQTVAHAIEAAAASKDLQDVTTQITLNYSLDPEKVCAVYRSLRRDYQSRIIDPAIQESVKASISQFDAEKLVVDRPRVKEMIESSLKTRLATHGILVDTISITDFKFSPEFTRAIELKVTAVQDAFRAQNELKKIEFEAQQRVTKAKAEAESLRLQKEQVTEGLLRLRAIEVQMKAVEKWDGKMPEVVTGNGPVPMLDVFNKK
jgi:regulator of protease activity HflC (stomatin/prohibitin superfamily)